MAIDFPSSPAAGQVFNVSPGVSFVYLNGLWTKAPLTTALPKNYIINPCMQVSEENGTTAVASANGIYGTDQWKYENSLATCTLQQVAAVTPYGSPNRLRLTCTATGTTTSRYAFIHQPIEGLRVADLVFGTAAARQMIIRLGIKTLAAAEVGVFLRNGSGTRLYATRLATTATDTMYTLIVPGDTAGTWLTDSNAGMSLAITLTQNTGNQSPIGSWTTVGNNTGFESAFNAVNNTVDLFDVGLYADPYKTGVAPPFVIPDIGVETRRGQRYWYKAFGLHGVVTSGTTSGRTGARHPVPMRVTPGGTVRGTPRLYDGAVTTAVSSLTTVCNAYAAEFDVTTGGTFASGGKETSMYFQTLNDYIAMNARL